MWAIIRPSQETNSDPLLEQGFWVFQKFLLLLCIWVYCSYLQTHQKRAPDYIADGWNLPCGCWELNSGPLEEQSMLWVISPAPEQVFFFFFLSFFWFFKTGFLYVALAVLDQAGLELRNPPASASQVLGLKACTTIARLGRFFFNYLFLFICVHCNCL